MIEVIVYAMVYMGSALMLYNIYSYARYTRRLQSEESWKTERTVLYVPTVLLVLFFVGYIMVGLFGNPDLVISGILFGGSIFVFVMFLFMQRITDRIQANERIEAKLMVAEQSNSAKTEFLASVSHEMRTPMNAIVGYAALALSNPDVTGETRVQLERIETSARHLEALINDILDMNSMETGELALQEAPFDLEELVDHIDSMAKVECEEKGIAYSSSVEEEAIGRYRGDADKLRRVLLNILQNAVKFTEAPGDVVLLVECSASDGGRRTLRFSVSDTGIGIAEESLPTLFDAFVQEDATYTNRYGGSGLGLALAKRLVDLMGGSIEVTSVKGAGSTFVVSVGFEELGPAEEALDDGSSATELADLCGRHVLVVDDIDVNAEILCDLLELEDVTSDRAENGEEAVRMFAESAPHAYDAILMDLRMPVMDGFEATRTIRALDRSDAKAMPIIAITANTSPEDRRNAIAVGMNEHLSKPVEADELYYNLRKCIARNDRGVA